MVLDTEIKYAAGCAGVMFLGVVAEALLWLRRKVSVV